MNAASLEALADGVRRGNVRAIARAISAIENELPGHEALLGALYRQTGRAAIVGLTGAPGAGKSSLVDGLVRLLRERSLEVGVLAVDPSSPFTGGAILGDRIRMQAHAYDGGVFIRSMSARGHLGGLAAATSKALHVLDAAGKDVVMVETVGVGQSELEIAGTADTTIVVLTPAAGDMVQMLKAGILEIADIFVVNKADLEGADRLVRDLRTALNLGEHGDWIPPILQTRATEGSGLDALWGAVEQHRAYLQRGGELEKRRRARLQAEILALAMGRLRAQLLGTINGREHLDELVDRALRREIDPYSAADAVLSSALAHPSSEDEEG
ncbi:MAG TPA: methylmalonyl Co-A mutase-associated GTPase MeaB [Chloroflexota bacterium]|nr:methylmalonyl Co-A mutase-associated GTPase MeaB [Chloroflexota bacterium]